MRKVKSLLKQTIPQTKFAVSHSLIHQSKKKKNNDIGKQHSKQAIRQAKLTKIKNIFEPG